MFPIGRAGRVLVPGAAVGIDRCRGYPVRRDRKAEPGRGETEAAGAAVAESLSPPDR